MLLSCLFSLGFLSSSINCGCNKLSFSPQLRNRQSSCHVLFWKQKRLRDDISFPEPSDHKQNLTRGNDPPSVPLVLHNSYPHAFLRLCWIKPWAIGKLLKMTSWNKHSRQMAITVEFSLSLRIRKSSCTVTRSTWILTLTFSFVVSMSTDANCDFSLVKARILTSAIIEPTMSWVQPRLNHQGLCCFKSRSSV